MIFELLKKKEAVKSPLHSDTLILALMKLSELPRIWAKSYNRNLWTEKGSPDLYHYQPPALQFISHSDGFYSDMIKKKQVTQTAKQRQTQCAELLLILHPVPEK